MTQDGAAAVSEQRQWDRLMTMAQFGAIPGDGVNRACLTRNDRAARRVVIGWAREIGLAVSIDEAANLWLRREGTDPAAKPVLTGSHMDSQPNGGRFDGIYGVIAGLEALTALHDAKVKTRRPIEVVAWTNEEGGRFAPGCMGSMSWAGHSPITTWADVRDHDGIRFADALAEHLAEEADLPRRKLGGAPHAYIEAHIEQGPRLEAEEFDIGAVTGIQGSRWFTVTLTGESAHAGTTPVEAASRRGAGHGARHRRPERADARSRRCAAVHRRPRRGLAQHLQLGCRQRDLLDRSASSGPGDFARAGGTRWRA